MLSVWRRVLGADNVISFSYEDAVARYGSSVPGVLAALSIDDSPLPSWKGVTANRRSDYEPSFGGRVTKSLARIPSIVGRRPRSTAGG
jgi:hypothetical protein